MIERKQYEFKGSAVRIVMDKEYPLSSNLTLRTWATSPEQARSNVTFQVKLTCNLEKYVKVKLYGDIYEV